MGCNVKICFCNVLFPLDEWILCSDNQNLQNTWLMEKWGEKKVFSPLYIIETKLDFVSVNDKNLQRWPKFIGERDFPIQISYAGQVQ